MKLTSVFNQGEKIPAKYTADGENINPPLEISRVPSGAKSLVLIVDDPDAPSGTWVHWVVINIPVSGSEFRIEKDSVPGLECMNDFRKVSYGGPSPPSGIHRYFFKVYALDIPDLKLKSSSEKADVEKAMNGHVLDKAELIGIYSRD